MPTARKYQVNLDATSYYHCISRCVRRAFLCGDDKLTDRNFDHRKQWLVDKMHEISQVFAIRICAYAVMSNHYHMVVRIDRDLALSWTDEEVLNRWVALYPYSKAAHIHSSLNLDFNDLTDQQRFLISSHP